MLAIIGYFAALVAVISMMPSQGWSPLPPAKPKLKYARMDCLNDIRYFMSYERFEICKGDNTYFCSYPSSELKIAIEQEYDFCPYYVFYGRVYLPEHTFNESFTLPARETDFFLVNYFNYGAAKSHRGKGYFSEHYICHHVDFGYRHLYSSPDKWKPATTALPSSTLGR